MEVIPGYKQSDVGIIPEDWVVVSLSEIGDSLIGLTYQPSKVRKYGTLVLRSSNVQNGLLCFDNNVFVETKIPERIKVRPGDILICTRNGSRKLIGKSAIIDERATGMTFGAFMGVFRSDQGQYLRHMFKSDIFKKQINEHLGATINQITSKSLKSFKVPLPQKNQERIKIADVLNNVDKVVAKKKKKKNLAIQCGVDENRIIVINPGVNIAEELNKKTLDKVENLLKNKTQRLITVSRYDKRKNHEKVIMALRNLKQIYPNIVYISIGNGNEKENIEKLVDELDLKEQVMFFNDISNELKNSLIAKSNIFVMPSITHKKSVEGFGIAYVEAVQYGVPSIGGVDGGASDAIDHEKTGSICDGNDLDAIYTSINSMLENKKYLEYGKAAKENSHKFKWDIIVEEYKKILS